MNTLTVIHKTDKAAEKARLAALNALTNYYANLEAVAALRAIEYQHADAAFRAAEAEAAANADDLDEIADRALAAARNANADLEKLYHLSTTIAHLTAEH
jgi:multidrug resistance efflux pump